jgi:hypothetical protein
MSNPAPIKLKFLGVSILGLTATLGALFLFSRLKPPKPLSVDPEESPFAQERNDNPTQFTKRVLKEYLDMQEKAEDWNWEDSVFLLRVFDVIPSEDRIAVTVISPVESKVNENASPIIVDSLCEPAKTQLIEIGPGGSRFKAANVDVLTSAKLGDSLATYCIDQTCSSIGPDCVIIKERN